MKANSSDHPITLTSAARQTSRHGQNHHELLRDLIASFQLPLPPLPFNMPVSPEERRMNLLQVLDSALEIVDETMAGMNRDDTEGSDRDQEEDATNARNVHSRAGERHPESGSR